MSEQMSRGMQGQERTGRPVVVRCARITEGRRCGTAVYTLQAGEMVGRLGRSGFAAETRLLQCEACGQEQILPVLVRREA